MNVTLKSTILDKENLIHYKMLTLPIERCHEYYRKTCTFSIVVKLLHTIHDSAT